MKVHLKQIPSQGLHLSGEEDCPLKELASEEIRCAGPLHYDVDVGVARDLLEELLDFLGLGLQDLEVIAEDLDGQVRPHAGDHLVQA